MAERSDVRPERLWTRLRCSRCRYAREQPGVVTVADLDAYDVPTRDRLRAAYGRIVQRVPDVREL